MTEGIDRRRPIDIWRAAILRKPMADVAQSDLTCGDLTWLPNLGRYAFRADPFGLWRDDRLYIFVEAFAYSRMIGHIEVLVYDKALNLLETRVALSEPWHLSHPFVFEADGETLMLPEARQSGQLRLYRAREFPTCWEPVCTIAVDSRAVDATPFRSQGRWWLFFALMDRRRNRGELHLAWADRLVGPWHPHPSNPVRLGLAATRPAGTALAKGPHIELPVQDCSKSYGGAIRRLTITRLDDREFDAADTPWLEATSRQEPYVDGVHTLAAAGPVTLIDFKRLDHSWQGAWLRRIGRARRRVRSRILIA